MVFGQRKRVENYSTRPTQRPAVSSSLTRRHLSLETFPIATSPNGEVQEDLNNTIIRENPSTNENDGVATQRMKDHPTTPMPTQNQDSEQAAYLAWCKRGISATSNTGIRACVTDSGQNLQLPAMDGITFQLSSGSVLPGTHGQSPQAALSRSQERHRGSFDKWCRRKNLVRTRGVWALPSDRNNRKPTDAMSPVSLGRVRSRSESDLTAVPAKKQRLDIFRDASSYCYSCGSLNLYQIRQRALQIANNPPPALIGSSNVFIIINGVVNAKMNKDNNAKKYGLISDNTTSINSRPNLFMVEEVNTECAIFKLKVNDSTEFPFDSTKDWKFIFCGTKILKNKSAFIFHYTSVSETLRLFVLATAAETDPSLHSKLPENWKLAAAMENTLIEIYNNEDKRMHLESILTQAGCRRLYHEMISIGWTPDR